jgi:hypothetical protein
MTDTTVGFLIHAGITLVALGVAWGDSRRQLKGLADDMDEKASKGRVDGLEKEVSAKASTETVDSVAGRLRTVEQEAVRKAELDALRASLRNIEKILFIALQKHLNGSSISVSMDD